MARKWAILIYMINLGWSYDWSSTRMHTRQDVHATQYPHCSSILREFSHHNVDPTWPHTGQCHFVLIPKMGPTSSDYLRLMCLYRTKGCVFPKNLEVGPVTGSVQPMIHWNVAISNFLCRMGTCSLYFWYLRLYPTTERKWHKTTASWWPWNFCCQACPKQSWHPPSEPD
mgnify:CR=1 FL=1